VRAAVPSRLSGSDMWQVETRWDAAQPHCWGTTPYVVAYKVKLRNLHFLRIIHHRGTEAQRGNRLNEQLENVDKMDEVNAGRRQAKIKAN
jgi:hypothetical protein